MNLKIIGVCTSNPDVLRDYHRACDLLGVKNLIEAAERSASEVGLQMAASQSPWTLRLTVARPDGDTSIFLFGDAFLNGALIDTEELSQTFLSFGINFVSRLSGMFCLFVWNSRNKSVSLIGDRLATQKIYFYFQDDTLIFASSIKSLRYFDIVPRAIDINALAQFLIASHLIDDRSLIDGVRVCKPASINVWKGGLWTESVYWTPTIGNGEDDGLDSWADRLAEAISDAVNMQCKSPLLIPLTGGLDSRVIGAFLPYWARQHAESCTFGHSHCYDVRYGRQVARAIGIGHKMIKVREDFFKGDLRAVSEIGDGEISIEALPMLHLLDAAAPGTTLLSGYLGDTLSGSNMPNIDGVPNEDDRFRIVWQKYFQKTGFSEEQLLAVLSPETADAVRNKITQKARILFGDISAPSETEKIVLLKLKTRQWRFTSYMSRALGSKFHFRSPFFDSHVMDTMLAMPLRYRINQRAYRRMLVRHAPHLASLKEQKTHRPVVEFVDLERRAEKSDYTLSPKRIHTPRLWRVQACIDHVDRSLIKLSGGWLGSHNRDQYVHHSESIRAISPNWFREWLLDRGKLEPFFDRRALEIMFLEHLSGRVDHSSRINNIVSFLAWREDMCL